MIQACANPTCPKPATYRGRCREHATKRDRDINRAGYRIYRSKRWQITRRKQLFDHPLCQCDDPSCQLIATDVDHIVPLERGGDPWNPKNLRSLAKGCHSRITRAAQMR